MRRARVEVEPGREVLAVATFRRGQWTLRGSGLTESAESLIAAGRAFAAAWARREAAAVRLAAGGRETLRRSALPPFAVSQADRGRA